MATYYSEKYQATENGAVTSATRGYAGPQGYGGRVRWDKASFVITPATGDILRLFRLKTGTRILSIKVTNADLGTNAPMDIGVYDVDGAAAGAVIDADLFTSALELGTAVAFNVAFAGTGEQITESGTYTQPRRGWSIAQLLNAAGNSGYTTDPGKPVDVCGTIGTVVAGASGFILVEIVYLDGD